MNLNEHLEKLEFKARLKKKLIFGLSFFVIIIGILRFNNKMEREEINKNKTIETPKRFQVHQKSKDSLQREKTITVRIYKLDSISKKKKNLMKKHKE